MSTSTKKPTKGIRYSDAQKKEIIDFVIAYNSENGRGGQSQAAEKFNISPITLAAWQKAAGISAPKKSKAPKKTKSAKASKVGRASRYSEEQKQEVIDFAVAYNEANGRGGQSKAATKFKISPITVMAWLKAAGVKSSDKGSKAKVSKVAKAPKAAKSAKGGNLDAKLSALLALSKQIAKTESELAQLNAKFRTLKASL
ncbi:MAG: hypothetical protein HC845_06705 [Akkermansiaceae bacterium]|nr:hypothetical protein [Akkermansiaceae bacterium]